MVLSVNNIHVYMDPNIPAPGDFQWTVLRMRVAIMGYILVAPEMVIYGQGDNTTRRVIMRKNMKKTIRVGHGGARI
jgi:hypothetical protein